MRKGFNLGDFELFWLEGGMYELDGGAIFGVVPKVLWQKKCTPSQDNYVIVADFAILVKTPAGNILLETGLGNKLTDKQKEIFRLRKEWDLPAELDKLGISREDVQHVILTHGDFDHAGGITMQNEAGGLELTFPHATHYLQGMEWEDVCHPNRRSAKSYWPINFEGLEKGKNLQTVDGEYEVVAGVRLFHTGGHTRGHQAVLLTSRGETAVHLGDLLPTPAFSNPLWVTAYDNFPLDSIEMKEEILMQAINGNWWFLFYHDPETLACKFDEAGEVKRAFRAE